MSPSGSRKREQLPSLFWRYFIAYLQLLVVVLLSYGAFLVWRITSLDLVLIFVGATRSTTPISATLTIMIGCVLFGVVLWAETFLREQVAERWHPMAGYYVILPLAGASAVGLSLQELFRTVIF
jgi:hypothetical protein